MAADGDRQPLAAVSGRVNAPSTSATWRDRISAVGGPSGHLTGPIDSE
jgi:hypothetical protein